LNHYKNFSISFILQTIRYNESICKTKKKSTVKLRKSAHLKEIGRKFYQKFATPFKMKKPEFHHGEVSERSKERRDSFLAILA
jgi:hypothetical protein